jgi:hypothetical protein
LYTDKHGNKYYKLALHLHTTLSDGRNTPQEVAEEYKANGYDAIAFTDHWHYGAARELCGVTVLSGIEYNVGYACGIKGEMHIVGIGMRYDPCIPRESSRGEIVRAIIGAGGIPILAHPAWSMNTSEDALALPEVEFTEIYNAVSEAHNSNRAYSDYFVDMLANRGKYFKLLATDDAHYYDGSDQCRGFVMVRAESPDADSLLASLKSGDFYASQGPHLSVLRDGDTLRIETSPCSVIATMSNKTYLPDRAVRGDGVCEFIYKIGDGEKWIRVEAVDKHGRRAYSSVIKL